MTGAGWYLLSLVNVDKKWLTMITVYIKKPSPTPTLWKTLHGWPTWRLAGKHFLTRCNWSPPMKLWSVRNPMIPDGKQNKIMFTSIWYLIWYATRSCNNDPSYAVHLPKSYLPAYASKCVIKDGTISGLAKTTKQHQLPMDSLSLLCQAASWWGNQPTADKHLSLQMSTALSLLAATWVESGPAMAATRHMIDYMTWQKIAYQSSNDG